MNTTSYHHRKPASMTSEQQLQGFDALRGSCWSTPKVTLLAVVLMVSLGLMVSVGRQACSQDLVLKDSATASMARELDLSPKSVVKRPNRTVSDADVARWIDSLSSGSYSQRKRAEEQLRAIGGLAVTALLTASQSGELELVDRAVGILQEIASRQTILPTELQGAVADTGHSDSVEIRQDAWQALLAIRARGGFQARQAAGAIDEVMQIRGIAARSQLADVGVFIGETQHVIRATMEHQQMVRVDEEFRGPDETLQLLAWVADQDTAQVSGASIREGVLRSVVSMPNLKRLSLTNGEVDLATIRAIRGAKSLRHLEFRYVTLSGEMVDEIAGLPIGVSLTLNGTASPLERVETLREKRPSLQVDFKQGGFLGVRCLDSFNACLINDVVSPSAAQKAGLLPNDVITGVDDKPVARFADLQQAINQHVPGDRIHIRFERNGEVMQTTAVLGKSP
ncbi:MAG: PDZ domain-containing protein [Planctomycetota bacterium]